MGLYKESRGLVVVGKAHRPKHKDSSGALQYTPDLRNVIFMSMKDVFVVFFHTLTV